MRLDGRRVLITGAGRGLGRACAAGLAEAGAKVVLVSRSADELEAAVERIRAAGGCAVARTCDVTHGGEVAELFANERIDVLLCNAGTNEPGSFVEVTEDRIDRMLGLNVKASFTVAQAAARQLIADGRPGAILFMSSQMGHVGDANRTVYCATKHAIEGLTRAMAVELGPHGIRVASIAPTYIRTPLTAPFFEDEAFASDVRSRIPLGRVGEVEDVVGAVVFLASPAAALITGTSLLVDGGWTAH